MSERNRFNVLWAPGKAGAANGQARAHGLKHVPYDQIDAQTDWRVYELPPGIAKKEEEWIRRHPHFGGVFEPEGFGTLIEPVNVEIVPPAGEMGAALGVAEGTEWWQTFVGAPAAWAVTRGMGSVGAITDNGLGPHSFTDPRLVESKIFDPAETDAFGGSHGNPVTGCAVGIAPLCGVTNYKIAGTDVRCSWTDVSNAWLHAKAKGLKAVNTSYGGGTSLLAAGTAATLKGAGIAIICAAGNSSNATQFPASNPNCYAVSAIDESGNLAGFSCRGKIDIAAPGVGLLTSTSGGGWAKFSGTSGAAPIISGILLLILARNPTWTGVKAMEHLQAMCTPKLPKESYGAGLPNAARAVGADTTPPPEPPVLNKMAKPTIEILSPTSVRASWIVPAGSPGTDVLHGWDARRKFDTFAPSRSSFDWLGLKPGAGYRFAVQVSGMPETISDFVEFKMPLTEVPPPVETWTQKSAIVGVSSTPYAPATVEQSRTTTTTTRLWEESNLGNVRNDRTETDATIENRTVPVPTN
jgi:hypothetical protein